MSNGFKIGDVIENHWAGPNNRYHLIVGRGSIKTGKYSTMSVYKTRMLLLGKMTTELHNLDINEPKHTKIGHIDYEGWLLNEMNKLTNGEGK